MALFSRQKKEDTAKATKKAAQKKPAKSAKTLDAPVAARQSKAHVIIRPHITEKAAILADVNAYAFEISPRATKTDVKAAIKDIYNKEPVKVNIAKKPAEEVLRRKGRGRRKGLTKAYVFLKKGETIDIV